MRHNKIYKHFYTQGRVDKSLVTEDIKGSSNFFSFKLTPGAKPKGLFPF